MTAHQHHSPDDAVLDRYLAGDALPDDPLIETILAADPSARARLETLRHALQQTSGSGVARETAIAWAESIVQPADNAITPASAAVTAISERVRSQKIAHFDRLAGGFRQTWRPWASVAAVACVISGLFVIAKHRVPSTPMHATEHVYTTTAGQRAVIPFADGTRITLAPSSRIQVSTAFGHENRTVTLDGQAFFEVPRAAGAPFVVRTGRITTRVLGTAFDVKAYAEDRSTRVVVTRGKVQMRNDFTRTVNTLTAGMLGAATDSTLTGVVVNDTALYTSWRDGNLMFRDAPVGEVLQTVSRWYDIDMRLGDTSLDGRFLTGAFDFESMQSAVTTLEVLLNAVATYERTASSEHAGKRLVITLRPRHASRTRHKRSLQDSFSTHTEVGR